MVGRQNGISASLLRIGEDERVREPERTPRCTQLRGALTTRRIDGADRDGELPERGLRIREPAHGGWAHEGLGVRGGGNAQFVACVRLKRLDARIVVCVARIQMADENARVENDYRHSSRRSSR